MLTDIQTWMNTCIICQQDKGTTANNAPVYPIATGEVFGALHCDVVGPFRRNNSIHRALDGLAQSFCRIAPPPHYLSIWNTKAVTDQGNNFLSNLMAEVCSILNIKQIMPSVLFGYRTSVNASRRESLSILDVWKRSNLTL